jgi:hypothetical protein
VNGTGSTQLTFGDSGTVSSDPSWISGGTQILMSHRDAAGNVNMWKMNADGSGLTQLTFFVQPDEGGDGDMSALHGLTFEFDVGGNGQSNPTVPAFVAINGHVTGLGCSAVGAAPRWKPDPRR